MPEPTPSDGLPVKSTEGDIRRVKSFSTERGSVYTYDSDGKSTRFRTATQEQCPREDITVFVDLDGLEEADVLSAMYSTSSTMKAHVLEVEEEGKSPRIIRDISEVKDPNKVAVGVIKDGSYRLFKKASVTPVVGWCPFEYRRFEEDGQWFSSRHVGNRVTNVEYENS